MEDAALLRTLAEALLVESPANEPLARFLADPNATLETKAASARIYRIQARPGATR